MQSQEFRRKVIDAFVSVVYLSDDHLRIAFNYSGGSNAEADFDLVMDAEAAAGELSIIALQSMTERAIFVVMPDPAGYPTTVPAPAARHQSSSPDIFC